MPVSPLLIAILFGLLSVGAFALGLKAHRATQPREGVTVEQSRRFGRLLMMAATALLFFLIAVIVRGDLKVLT
jgi:hypothetical protein